MVDDNFDGFWVRHVAEVCLVSKRNRYVSCWKRIFHCDIETYNCGNYNIVIDLQQNITDQNLTKYNDSE